MSVRAFIWFLPAYSPDFNPVELVWSKATAVLRRLKARTFVELQKALQTTLALITLEDIKNWFKHDDYALI